MDKKQKEQNKLLKKVFILLGVVLIGFLLVFFILGESKTIRYNELTFKIVQEGQLTFYHTTLPLLKNGTKIADWNFYLRTNPNELKSIPFDGNLSVRKMVVFNPKEELNCDGDGVIAIGNIIQNLYGYLNVTSVIRDENATCDVTGRYSLVDMKVANVTEVKQVGSSCYEINVANCEILKGTERYMIEALSKINDVINKKN